MLPSLRSHSSTHEPAKGVVATASAPASAKKSLFTALRVLISAGLIGYLLVTADLGALVETLRSWNGLYFVVAVFLGIVRNVVFALRWKVTLTVSDTRVPFSALIKFYFVGTFFNLFLPTALGGDVVRGYDLAVYSGKRMGAATSVLMERIVGFFALAFIALLALLAGSRVIQDVTVITVILVACLSYFALTALFFNAKIMRRFVAMFRFIRIWNLGERIAHVYESLYVFSGHKSVLWQCFALSIAGQTLAVLAAYALALAINLKLAPVYFFMVLPMIWILTMIPLSVNGLGIREGAFVFFFTKVGVPNFSALLLSFLNFSQMVALGLIGGVLYIVGQVFPAGKAVKG